MFICIYCDREFNTKNAQAQHLIRCSNNPSKIDLSYLSGAKNLSEYMKKVKTGEIIKDIKNQWSIPDFKISKKTSEKLSQAGKLQVWSDDRKIKHSTIMKIAVDTHPESYTSSNRGRTKQIIFDGIKFQGSWELGFYKWCKLNNVKCVRYDGPGFKYEWNGIRTYFPDFYLPEVNSYVEVKGYKTERDTAKWIQFPEQLITVQKQDIISINKNTYKLPL